MSDIESDTEGRRYVVSFDIYTEAKIKELLKQHGASVRELKDVSPGSGSNSDVDADSVLRPFYGGSLSLESLRSRVVTAVEQAAVEAANATVEGVVKDIAEALSLETDDLIPVAQVDWEGRRVPSAGGGRTRRIYAFWESRTTLEEVECRRKDVVRLDVVESLLDDVRKALREGYYEADEAVENLEDIESCLHQAIREVKQEKQKLKTESQDA